MIKFKKTPDEAKEIEAVLHPYVKKWFFSKFKEFSLPQKFAVKSIHDRKNILVSAPTGATKTLTGFLAILNELVTLSDHNNLQDKVYAIYVSPLKALNNDIQKNLKEPLEEIEKIAGKDLGIRVAVRTGDTTALEKTHMLKRPPHILITTPESLAIVLSSIKFKEFLKETEFIIIDEIHALAESKRGVHLSLSLERLQKMAPYLARVGLSATVSPLEEIANFLVGMRDCQIVDVSFIKQMDLKVLSPLPDLINTTAKNMSNAMYDLMDTLIQEHKTTVIFTNTRSATERVVHHLKESFPKNYSENIGAHHGSLSKEHRFNIEERLRKGELKVVVTSTSLELGIDIGYIDLVILLGSPKSVARALQRIGRSGHQLHSTTKGRIIVLDRDDLVECSVLLKSAIEHKIDKIHIPRNALDVLAQQIYGIAISDIIHVEELFSMIKMSYCYSDLSINKFMDVIDYLSGKHISLEDRHIYAKIWYDSETKMIGKKGKMSRVIYMTNIGTIPDESFVTVKIGEQSIGKIDEGFLEKLKRGDVFVLGGNTYQFQHAKGLVAQVKSVVGRPPTVPHWFSEVLPLSFDLSQEISRFRKLMDELFTSKKSEEDIIAFVNKYLYVDENGANAIYEYFKQQNDYAEIPHVGKLLIEHYDAGKKKYAVFHSLYGRRVNDVLSRGVAFAIARSEHKDVEIGISDNGFYIAYPRKMNVVRAFNMLKSDELDKVMDIAIDKTEVLRRRFRHCAMRSLMILRNYKGRQKLVGRQQVSSMVLLSAVMRISRNFPILDEARREVLHDLMDVENSKLIIQKIEKGEIKIKEISTTLPSPFAFNLVLQGHFDMMKADDKIEFLKRMHDEIARRIAEPRLKVEKKSIDKLPVDYNKLWHKEEVAKEEKKLDEIDELKQQLLFASKRLSLDANLVYEIGRLIDGDKGGYRDDFKKWLAEFSDGKVPKAWGDEIAKFLVKKNKEVND